MITDTEARKIASDWHGGGGTALYALASTGAINTARKNHDLDSEIEACFPPSDQHGPDVDDLYDLLVYVVNQGTRGPVPGWANLTW